MTLDRHNLNISLKANRILNLILIALLLIVVRIWHLSFIQYDEKLEDSRRPQRRTIMEPAKRATIRDRYNVPLAINKLQYNISILYSQLRQIPPVSWEKDSTGKRHKRFKRREYITRLSEMLAVELNLDPVRLEDLIHSKASLYYSLPYVIKEDISEGEYYRLKILEKDWLGIHVQKIPKRHYPLGKAGGDILGYMGAINRQEYEGVLREIKALETFLRECDAENDLPELPAGIHSEAQAREKLKDLREHAYTLNDYVGKAGIEGRFERALRGYHGKKTYYSDARGNFLRELPGAREPNPGQQIHLTISSELQEYAELLLTQNEKIREGKASSLDQTKQVLQNLRQPWIKGGGILALDPKTGEIIAMASYPRFDPNDFILSGSTELLRQKKAGINRWFENETYIGDIWDQKRDLERERYDEELGVFYEESKKMTLENFLEFILPKNSPVSSSLMQMKNIATAVEIQRNARDLLSLSGQENLYAVLNALYKGDAHVAHSSKLTPAAKQNLDESLKQNGKEVAVFKKKLDLIFKDIPENFEKVLLVDLCRLLVQEDLFDSSLLEAMGKQSLETYREASAAKIVFAEALKKMSAELYRDLDFRTWRLENEKTFLKEKRKQEKTFKLQPKPYTDYLDAKENELFQIFWKKNGWELLLAFLSGVERGEASLKPYLVHFQRWQREIAEGGHPEVHWRPAYLFLKKILSGTDSTLAIQYLKTLRGFQDLNRPLLGLYRHLRKIQGKQLEKHLAGAFYPPQGFGYGRSQIFRQAASQGSIFKLVTAYAALAQRYQELNDKNLTAKKLNPLEMIDQTHRKGKETYVGYTLQGKPIPRAYKGGRLPRSTHAIGRLDLVKAIENSSNPYFSLLAGDILKTPEELASAAKLFSYGQRTGIDLPAEISGKVPSDLATNRTGLYAMAIGQHSLVVTPLQTGIMLSAIANGGQILKPKIIHKTAGCLPFRKEESEKALAFPYQEELAGVGLNFPLFQSYDDLNPANRVTDYPTVVKSEVFFPSIIRNILLEGMRKVVIKTQDDCLASLSRFYRDYPEAISDYIDLKKELVGKTSTAEVVEHLDLSLNTGTNLYTHVWFGGIAFDKREIVVAKDSYGEPELVVVVYLRYGSYGKEAAPVAAQIVKRWREIKSLKSL